MTRSNLSELGNGASSVATTPSSTHRLLLDCMGYSFRVPSRSGLRNLSTPHVDWDGFVDLASHHTLAALAYSAIRDAELPAPLTVQRQLQASSFAARLRLTDIVEPALQKILRALSEAGLEPLLLKGPALAYTVYPQPEHRSFSDIDLLLRDGELLCARKALCRIGIRGNANLDEPGHTDRSRPYPNHHLRALSAPGGQLEIELHRHLISQPQPYSIALDGFRRRSILRNVAGLEVRVLSAPDELLFACLHLAYSHRYLRLPLRSLVDILAITTAHFGRMDWELFVESVRHARADGAIFWPLFLARTWLGAPIPKRVLSLLAPSTRVRKLLRVFLDPAYILDQHVSEDREVLYRLLIEASLFSSCTKRELASAMLNTLYAPERGRGDGLRSGLHAAGYLAHPKRLARGLRCCTQLVSEIAS